MLTWLPPACGTAISMSSAAFDSVRSAPGTPPRLGLAQEGVGGEGGGGWMDKG
jgi:hypothetical protein